MKVAAPPSDAELPHFDALLRSGSFHERLERARQQRERLLAAQAADPGAASGVEIAQKPWEHSPKGSPRPSGAPSAAGSTKVAAPEFAIARTAPARAAPEPDAPRQPTWMERVLAMRTAAGFVAGLAVGVAVAWAVSVRSPEVVAELVKPTSVTAVAVTEATPAAEDRGGGETVSTPALEDAALLAASSPAADPPVQVRLPDLFAASAVRLDQPLPAVGPAPHAVAPLAPSGLAESADAGQAPEPIASVELPAPAMRPAPLAGPTAPDQPLPAPALAAPLAMAADAARVRVHILLPGAGDRAAGAEAAEQLQSAGYQKVETAETGIRIRETNVRYYHGADAAAAAAIARQLGTTARDFTAAASRPPQGMIEVWLKSSLAKPTADPVTAVKPAKVKAAKSAPKKAKKAPPPAPSEAAELQALRDRVLMQLLSAKEP